MSKSKKLLRFEEQEREERERFLAALDAANDLDAVKKLIARMPPPDTGGRGFYTRLQMVALAHVVPGDDVDYFELEAYLRLVDRIAGRGLDVEVAERLREEVGRKLRGR